MEVFVSNFDRVLALTDDFDDEHKASLAAQILGEVNPTKEILRIFYNELDEIVRGELEERFDEWAL